MLLNYTLISRNIPSLPLLYVLYLAAGAQYWRAHLVI
jgi:hypothetical protein